MNWPDQPQQPACAKLPADRRLGRSQRLQTLVVRPTPITTRGVTDIAGGRARSFANTAGGADVLCSVSAVEPPTWR